MSESNNCNWLTPEMCINCINTGFKEVPSAISLNIYVQGCKLRCKNCQNPDLQPFTGGVNISGEEFIDILKNKNMASWVVWLGGDAVYQPDALMSFNKIAHKFGYKVCLYTGLIKKDIDHLLDDVDLLIDGPYDELTGTVEDTNTNQNIYIKKSGKWVSICYNEIIENLGKV